MRFLDRLDDRVILFLLGLEDRVVIVDALHRNVGRNRDDVHAVDIAELLLLGEGGTGHAGLLVKFIEEVLERDGCQRSGLLLDFHVLLSLDCLVKTVGIAAARHNAAREVVDDQDLVILDDVILVSVHEVVGAKGQIHGVLDLQVLRVGQVLDVEELLDLMHARLGQRDDLILFVDDEIARLGDLFAHDRGHLGHLAGSFAPLELARQDVADLVDLG